MKLYTTSSSAAKTRMRSIYAIKNWRFFMTIRKEGQSRRSTIKTGGKSLYKANTQDPNLRKRKL